MRGTYGTGNDNLSDLGSSCPEAAATGGHRDADRRAPGGRGGYPGRLRSCQAPVPLVPASSGLKLGFFTDAGSVWGYKGTGSTPALSQSLQVADSSAIRSSFGAGLIWDSPFGPIRADYAIPMTKTSYDITQRFSFSAGHF